ncbi:MAG: hypothetical protein ABIK32_00900 [Chloroflexota bacterium]|nr:OB-fold putative lipoprotein [Chloroflexota bacterium]
MPNCPNCGRETLRTEDWACQWCGHPLLSGAFKTVPKTYRQIQEERGYKPRPVLEDEPEPAPVAEVEAEPAPPVPEPEPEIEPETPAPPEPLAEVEAEAKAESEIEPSPELEGEPVAEEKSIAEAEPVAVAEVEAETEPAPAPDSEAEPAPEPVTEIEPEVEPAPATEPVAATALEPDASTGTIITTVEELNAAFNSDKTGTNNKLLNKILQVTGTVDKIFAKDHLDIFYILLGGAGGRVTRQVRCTFSREHGTYLSRLTDGQTATVQGTYVGYERNIILKDCSLV